MSVKIEEHPEAPERPFWIVWTREPFNTRVITAYDTRENAEAMMPEMTRRCEAADAHGWEHA